MNQTNLPIWARSTFLILSIIGIGLLLKYSGLEHFLDREWIDGHLRNQGEYGYFVFLFAGVLMAALGFPRQLISFFAGYAFGVTMGFVLAALAAIGGCVLTVYYARMFGRGLVRGWFPGKIQKFDEFVAEYPFTKTLMVRLLPLGSNLVTNLIAGVSQISKPKFFAGSFIGYLPQTMIFALAGGGVIRGSHWQLALSIILLVISIVLGVRLYRKMRSDTAYSAAMEVA